MPDRIGKYEILAEIGKGGFGSVYRAYDSSLGRNVAIKVLSVTDDPGLLTRFRNEASAAGNLHHENIVTIYEFGKYEGVPFIAMELLAGEDLSRIIADRKPLTVLQKVRVMSQVASALSCAHRSGVVHRDVKPANIMVQPDGLVKIMDFGIARLTGGTGTRLTHHGYIIGTLMYMAPEQFTDMEADPACDIFAYGIVFYEFLTGRHPFKAAAVPSSVRQIGSEDPPPIRDLVPDCPIELQDVISRAIEKDRELRYQSLQDLLFDLAPVQAELNRGHARELAADARERLIAGDFTGAQEIVLQAIELDATNPEAGRLHDEIQKRAKREKILPRKAELLRTAEREFANRRYRKALDCYDSALRLDSTDEKARDGAARARAALEQSEIASSLIEQAHRDLDAKNLTGAYRNASEALRAEPANSEASRLTASIQQEIERREGDRRLNDALGKARSLFLLDDFDGALAVLRNLDERLRQDDQVRRLIERILARKAGPERETVEMARPEAGASVRPDDEEGFRHAMERARELLERNEVEPAVRVLQMTAQRYPDEPALVALFAEAQARLRAIERPREVQAAVEECEGLRRGGKLIAATEKLAAWQQQLGQDSLLLAARARLDSDWGDVQSAISLAAQQEESGQSRAALETIQGAQARFTDIPELRIIAARLSRKAVGTPAAPPLNPDFWSATRLVSPQSDTGFASLPAWPGSGAAAAAKLEPAVEPVAAPVVEDAPRARSRLLWFVLGGVLLAALAASAAVFVLRRAPARVEATVAKPEVKIDQARTAPAPPQPPPPPVADAQPPAVAESPARPPVEAVAQTKPEQTEHARVAEPRRSRRAKADDEEPEADDLPADTAAAPAAPDSSADDRSYNGPPRISVAWAGALAPSAQLTFRSDSASEGRITNGAILPQFSGTVEATPAEAQVVELPSRQNGYRVVIRNNSDHPLETIKLIWRPAK